MYNPNGVDSGREWVELYNDGTDDATLVGGSGAGSWRIADSSNHTLVAPPGSGGRGSLVVPAGGYLVVASDPATFIGEFGGSYSVVRSAMSLVNTGATISLINGSGTTVSAFTYTSASGGNDDGTSLQLHAGAILQALPTPGAANATAAYTPPADTDDVDNAGSGSASVAKVASPNFVAAPLPQVFADAGDDRTVIVGADTQFVALAYDRDKSVIRYAKFLWTFGDGTQDFGPVVMHHFSYPGRYAVELTVVNDAFRRSDRIVVVAEPASVALAALPHGGAAIQNFSGRDLDLSFWRIEQGSSKFVLPEHTVVLKDSAVNVSAATLGFTASDAELKYPDGSKVAVVEETKPEPAKAAAPPAPAPVVKSQPAPSLTAAPKLEPPPKVPEPIEGPAEPVLPEEPKVVEALPLAAAAAASGVEFPLWASMGGLGGLIGLGMAGVIHLRRLQTAQQKEGTVPGAEEFAIE